PNGQPTIRIADMDPQWRYNASRWLERNAEAKAATCSHAETASVAATRAAPLGPSETSADMIERDIRTRASERNSDPRTWIRATALYRALVADLPACLIALDAIATRARHWSTCPVRTGGSECRCQK